MKDQEERGRLSKKAQEIAKNFLGEEITTRELRLYPYIDFCLKNCGIIQREKINSEEVAILEKRQAEGHLKKSGKYITVTRAFYDFIQDILAETYVLFETEGK